MNINDYILKEITALQLQDSVKKAQTLFKNHPISHFPVIENNKLIGSFSENDIHTLENTTDKLADYSGLLQLFFTDVKATVLELLKIFATHNTSILPVVNEHKEYLGYYDVCDVLDVFATSPFMAEDTEILVVEKIASEYSIGEVSQIVEAHGGNLLGLFVSEKSDDVIQVTLKIEGKAVNDINGLMYGNGGLSCWTKDFIYNMRTHEASDGSDDTAVEFCYDPKYLAMNNVYSTTYPNGSDKHAFRAGFREGVKMSTDQGARVRPDEFKEKIWWQNYNRLQTWCNIGSDVENGLWAIYGARLGCEMTVLTEWDSNLISDYDWFKDFFTNTILPRFPGDEICKYTKVTYNPEMLYIAVQDLGNKLNESINSMMLFDPNP